MHEELVKQLRDFSQMMPEGGDCDPLIEVMSKLAEEAADAISVLTAPQAETCEKKRDFSDAALWRDAAFETSAQIVEKYFPDGSWKYITDDIRALKSNTVIRPWTRDDGSTIPRGDVVDRRKSAEGDITYQCGYARDVGRRSADRSRWVQETPQTLEREWCAKIGAVRVQELDQWAAATASREIRGAFVWLLRELDRRSVK